MNDDIHNTINEYLPAIRTVVSEVALPGIALPAFSVALGYFDNFRSEEMSANLIQV